MILTRPASASDREAIEAMHAECSLASRIGRWHAPLRSVPARYLDDALSGRPGHVCAVACRAGDVVAFASAVRGFGESWDLGVLVRDDLQRRGVGSALIEVVVRTARERAASWICADLRPDRRFLLDVLRRYGPLAVRLDGDGLHARVDVSAGAMLEGRSHVATGESAARPARVGLAG